MSINDLNTGFPEIDGTMNAEEFVTACKEITDKMHSKIAEECRKVMARTGWNLERIDDDKYLWTIILTVNPNGEEDFFGINKDGACYDKVVSMMTPCEVLYALRDVWQINNENQLAFNVGRSNVIKVSYIAITKGGHMPILALSYDDEGDVDFSNITDYIEDEITREAIYEATKDPVVERYVNYINKGAFTVQDVLDAYNNRSNPYSLFERLFGFDSSSDTNENGDTDEESSSETNCGDEGEDSECDGPNSSKCDRCICRNFCSYRKNVLQEETKALGSGAATEGGESDDSTTDEAAHWLVHQCLKGKGIYSSYMQIAPCLFVSKEMDAIIVVPTFDQMNNMLPDKSFAAGTWAATLTSWCKKHGYQYRLSVDDAECSVITDENGVIDFRKIVETITEERIGNVPSENEWKLIFGE